MTFEHLWLDTGPAIRLWARTPGFSAIAIATIGLGIRASTALVGQGLLYARIEPRSGGLVQAQRRQFFEDAVTRLRPFLA